MTVKITGREPALSGAIDTRLYEAWVQFPLGQRSDEPIKQLCLGVFNHEVARKALIAFADYHYPGKCHFDDHGQFIYENEPRGYNAGFLWPYGVSKR